MKMLALFSDPPETPRLRLDKEDQIIAELARKYNPDVQLERLHASRVDNIYALLSDDHFDVVHFSGHGNPDGIYLEKSDMHHDGGIVGADRLQSLLEICEIPPKLVVLLSCYSNESREYMTNIAPFVITTEDEIDDNLCLSFVKGFYDRLFSGFPITRSFEDSKRLLRSRNLGTRQFHLSRRQLIRKANSKFIESTPSGKQETILLNLDDVAESLDSFQMSEEELCHILAKKIQIHYWIFSVPRERCIIPIGKFLFGEFDWSNAEDVIFCRRIIRFSSEIEPERWRLWSSLLIAYNDLASHEYRLLDNPSNPVNRRILNDATRLFLYVSKKNLAKAKNELLRLRIKECLPVCEFIFAHIDSAEDYLEMERFPQLIQALEEALTNLHQLVEMLQPPEHDESHMNATNRE